MSREKSMILERQIICGGSSRAEWAEGKSSY
jgi:hypothetical protein